MNVIVNECEGLFNFGKEFDKNQAVNIDHETQTFEIDGKKLNRHQALTITIGLISYYENREFIDSKGDLWDIRDHLKTLLG
jgi:hypothetical protein